MLDLRSLVPWGQKAQAPVKHEDDYDPFVSFRRDMDRLFDNFFSGIGTNARGGNGMFLPTSAPRLDVTENEKEIFVSAELPGVSEKDFDVTLAGDILTIKGEKKHEHEEKEGERHYVERRYGSFSRSVRLPFEASDQDVSADFKNGVLTIAIPKPADAASNVKRVEVRSS